MSVAPDLLLRSAPVAKPKMAAAKAPEKPAETRESQASSFAQVYAKERQAKTAERSDAMARADQDKARKAADGQHTRDAAAIDAPPLADGGKPLPIEPEQGSSQVGFGPAPEPDLAAAGLLPSSANLGANLSAILDAATALASGAEDGEGEAATLLMGQAGGKGLSAGVVSPALATPITPTALAAQSTQSAGQNFASALGAFAQQPVSGEAGKAALGELGELEISGLESLKDSAGDNRADSNRLGTLNLAATQQPTAAQRAALVPGVPVPMQQGGWSEAVVDRVMWLSSQNLKSAEIQLDPAELGRLEVRINVSQDQTQVTFVSPNAQVRDALEGQMYRLRELFAQQGMNQLDVSVSDQSLNRGNQGQSDGRGSQGRSGAHADEPILAEGQTEIRGASLAAGRGMVDYYA
ncbi:MAG: flagellar hook-length control protein FliK [Pseudomonas sp.]